MGLELPVEHLSPTSDSGQGFTALTLSLRTKDAPQRPENHRHTAPGSKQPSRPREAEFWREGIIGNPSRRGKQYARLFLQGMCLFGQHLDKVDDCTSTRKPPILDVFCQRCAEMLWKATDLDKLESRSGGRSATGGAPGFWRGVSPWSLVRGAQPAEPS